VAADAWAGAEDLHPRVAIGQRNGLPNIHSQPFCQAGKLIGDGDVHIAIGVFHEFNHFGSGGVGKDDFAFDKGGIQFAPGAGRFRRNATDDARVFDQLAQNLPRQHSFGGIGQIKIYPCLQTGALQDRGYHFFGCARG
jgi:hypothetical protein